MSNPNNIQVGDKVTFTDATARRNRISFKTLHGIVHEVRGDTAIVRRGISFDRVPLEDVRKEGQPSALTDMFRKTHNL